MRYDSLFAALFLLAQVSAPTGHCPVRQGRARRSVGARNRADAFCD
jgi:hypothetical protein